MIKVHVRRKDIQESLRPLTEKEIQKKLYGAFTESVEAEERPETKWFDPRRRQKEKKKFAWPDWKVSLPPLPWRKLLSVWRRFFSAAWAASKGILNFSILLLGKVPVRWAVGFFSVVLLFLGIHALNAYRTAAMKAPRPAAVVPVVNEAQPDANLHASVAKPAAKLSALSPVSASPVTVKPTPPTRSELREKPYVIQVATYANQQDAQRLVEQIKEARFPVFIEPFNRPHGKIFYLVFLGRFGTFQEAEAKFKEFHQKPIAKNFQDSFIRMK